MSHRRGRADRAYFRCPGCGAAQRRPPCATLVDTRVMPTTQGCLKGKALTQTRPTANLLKQKPACRTQAARGMRSASFHDQTGDPAEMLVIGSQQRQAVLLGRQAYQQVHGRDGFSAPLQESLRLPVELRFRQWEEHAEQAMRSRQE